MIHPAEEPVTAGCVKFAMAGSLARPMAALTSTGTQEVTFGTPRR